MLLTARTYKQTQAASRKEGNTRTFGPLEPVGWRLAPEVVRHTKKMLFVHQTGTVRIGEVVRQALSGFTDDA